MAENHKGVPLQQLRYQDEPNVLESLFIKNGLDPDLLVDEVYNMIIKPTKINGQVLNLATYFDPNDLADESRIQQLAHY